MPTSRLIIEDTNYEIRLGSPKGPCICSDKDEKLIYNWLRGDARNDPEYVNSPLYVMLVETKAALIRMVEPRCMENRCIDD